MFNCYRKRGPRILLQYIIVIVFIKFILENYEALLLKNTVYKNNEAQLQVRQELLRAGEVSAN